MRKMWFSIRQDIVTHIKLMAKPLIHIDLGKLDQIEPVSTEFGFDRGKPIDRYYIENFLIQNTEDIRGRVLEIGDNAYTKKFGDRKVEQSDILHVIKGNPSATIVADIAHADNIPSSIFDCIILTQTLQFVYGLSAAVNHLYRILKPNGVLLITVPGISQISRYDMDRWGDFWRFTTLSTQKLFEEKFSPEDIEVKSYGNVLAATAFLYGLAVDDLKPEQLNYYDPDYQMLITVRAVKSRIE